jgi:MarR family transcriptional regulator, negative regulator of the multidrug operon emrRAB
MPHAYDEVRRTNLLAALALALSDRLQLAAERAAGLGAGAPAALISLDSARGPMSIDALSERLRLSHSGAVRLVDRLVAAGLVERRRGADRRSVALALTPRGRRAAGRVHAAREATMTNLEALLTSDQQALLTTVQERLLGAVDELAPELPWLCRLCDRHTCRRGRGGCPVEQATNRRQPRLKE